MSKAEIAKRIEEVEDILFYINMKDRWDSRDYAEYDKFKLELAELEQSLKKS